MKNPAAAVVSSMMGSLLTLSRRVIFSSDTVAQSETNVPACRHNADCIYPEFCMHDAPSDDGIDEIALWHGTTLRKHQTGEIERKAIALLRHRPSPAVLVACGLTSSVLESARVTLKMLVCEFHYIIEDILTALRPTWNDLRRLEFHPKLLAERRLFAPIAFYEAGLREHHLLRFTINYRYLHGELSLNLEELYVMGFRAPLLCRVLGMNLIDVADALLDQNQKWNPDRFVRLMQFNEPLYKHCIRRTPINRMTEAQIQIIELTRVVCGRTDE